MYFGYAKATAIDLCVKDFVEHSKYHNDTTIIGESVQDPFDSVDFRPVARRPGTSQRAYAKELASIAASQSPDVVVVHQHIASAMEVRRALPDIPVILYRHNGIKRPSFFLRRYWAKRALRQFDRIVFVSDFIRNEFVSGFPALHDIAVRIHNGLDIGNWVPKENRERVVLFVGRATPEKGALQTVRALRLALADRPEWRGRLILSGLDGNLSYIDELRAAIGDLGEQITLEFDLPHSQIKRSFEDAAVAVVPSTFAEPFGRTALEAFAGGAALITSMRGGLREIADGAAVEIDPDVVAAFADKIRHLTSDEASLVRFADLGRKRARELFEIAEVSSQLDSVYREAVRKAQSIPT